MHQCTLTVTEGRRCRRSMSPWRIKPTQGNEKNDDHSWPNTDMNYPHEGGAVADI